MQERKRHLEELDYDMDQVRYDIGENEKQVRKKQEERKSILEQLALTDYEEIKERLDACVKWLGSYPAKVQKAVKEKTQAEDEAGLIIKQQNDNDEKIKEY